MTEVEIPQNEIASTRRRGEETRITEFRLIDHEPLPSSTWSKIPFRPDRLVIIWKRHEHADELTADYDWGPWSCTISVVGPNVKKDGSGRSACRGYWDAYGPSTVAGRFALAVMGGMDEVEPPGER